MFITAALLSFCSPLLNFLFLYNCYYKCFLLFYNHHSHFWWKFSQNNLNSISSGIKFKQHGALLPFFFFFCALKCCFCFINSPLNLLMYDSRLAYSWLWKFFPAFVNIMSYIFIILFYWLFPHNYKQIWLFLPTQKFFLQLHINSSYNFSFLFFFCNIYFSGEFSKLFFSCCPFNID